MSGVTKAKVNFKEGTLDLEGSEEFVSRFLESFQENMTKFKVPDYSPQVDLPQKTEEAPNNIIAVSGLENSPSKRKPKKASQSVSPIAIDLTAKDGNPSLIDFFNEKMPKSNQEAVTLFAYYLKYYQNTPSMKEGHAVSCFQEVNRPIPNIKETFSNSQRFKAWLELEEGGESVHTTIKGENLVKFGLPKNNATKNKVTA